MPIRKENLIASLKGVEKFLKDHEGTEMDDPETLLVAFAEGMRQALTKVILDMEND